MSICFLPETNCDTLTKPNSVISPSTIIYCCGTHKLLTFGLLSHSHIIKWIKSNIINTSPEGLILQRNYFFISQKLVITMQNFGNLFEYTPSADH